MPFTRSLRRSAPWALLTLLTTAPLPTLAQFVVESLSFGHADPLAPNGRTIPSWQVFGSDHEPDILSDRIVLTPPAPGNKRGGLWTEHPLTYLEWTIDVEFRASGPERGSGNLQVWVTKEQPQVASVYTAERFEGLVLELDQYGGSGGSLRGFLNDGSVTYRGHHNVDGLAFGHCDYAYRNLGRMSRLKVRMDNAGLEVMVDDKSCFKSGSIQIPQGYFLGVSAASAENPDSFEVSKFIVSTTTSITRDEPRTGSTGSMPPPPPESHLDGVRPPPPSPQEQQPPPPPPQQQQPTTPFGAAPPATLISDAAYKDLLSRLDALSSTLSAISTTSTTTTIDLRAALSSLSASLSTSTDLLRTLSTKLTAVEQQLGRLQSELDTRGDVREHLTGLHLALRDTQEKLMSGLGEGVATIKKSGPGLGGFVGVVVVVQVVSAVGYVWYKRRRAMSPKKYL